MYFTLFSLFCRVLISIDYFLSKDTIPCMARDLFKLESAFGAMLWLDHSSDLTLGVAIKFATR